MMTRWKCCSCVISKLAKPKLKRLKRGHKEEFEPRASRGVDDMERCCFSGQSNLVLPKHTLWIIQMLAEQRGWAPTTVKDRTSAKRQIKGKKTKKDVRRVKFHHQRRGSSESSGPCRCRGGLWDPSKTFKCLTPISAMTFTSTWLAGGSRSRIARTLLPLGCSS